jgi:hypothetical protein
LCFDSAQWSVQHVLVLQRVGECAEDGHHVRRVRDHLGHQYFCLAGHWSPIVANLEVGLFLALYYDVVWSLVYLMDMCFLQSGAEQQAQQEASSAVASVAAAGVKASVQAQVNQATAAAPTQTPLY